MTKQLLLALVLAPAVAAAAAAQATPQPQSKPPAAQAPPAQAPPAQAPPAQAPAPKPAAPRPAQASRGTVTFFVTGVDGKPIPDASVAITGPTDRQGTTNENGVARLQSVRAGAYRARVEAEGFITLERDLTARSGLEVEMTLDPAPKPPEPPPAPAVQTQPKPSTPVLAPDPNATVQLSSVVEFFSRNKLGRTDPRSESVVGRAGESTSSLLQIRSTVEGRSNPSADEVLYVINGKAEVTSKGRTYQLETGSLLVVPRGVSYSIVNQGRDPLWALSVLSGQAQ